MDELRINRDIPSENLVTGGHSLCSGCGPAIGQRLALLALGPKTIMINSAGCLTLVPTHPFTPYKIPWIFEAIENGAATGIGIRAALRALGKGDDWNVLAYIGDGASYDIGFQSLSHLVERGDNVIYICYNNQNFANTGHQMSAATPKKAITNSTPMGNPFWRKPLAKIIAAHGNVYVATASVGYPLDFMNKLVKASKISGPKFIDLLAPCQPGWNYSPEKTVKLAKLAVDSGAWPLYEVVDGKFRLTHKPEKLKPVREYLEHQRRFQHLEEDIQEIQNWVSEEWNQLINDNFWEAKEY